MIPQNAMAPDFGGIGRATPPANVLPQAEPAADPKSPTLGVRGSSPGAPMSKPTWSVKAREAHRCACEGVRLIHEGRPAQAIAPLKRSVKLNPGVASSHHDLGVAFMNAGRLEQAAEAFAAAVRLDLGLASAHHLLGYVFDKLGQEAKAMESYRAAVALKPDLVLAQLRLGDYYRARRLRVAAAAAFRAAAAATVGTVAGPNRRGARPRRLWRLRRGSRRDARHRRDESGERGSSRVSRQTPRRGRPFGGGRGASAARDRAFARDERQPGPASRPTGSSPPRTAR